MRTVPPALTRLAAELLSPEGWAHHLKSDPVCAPSLLRVAEKFSHQHATSTSLCQPVHPRPSARQLNRHSQLQHLPTHAPRPGHPRLPLLARPRRRPAARDPSTGRRRERLTVTIGSGSVSPNMLCPLSPLAPPASAPIPTPARHAPRPASTPTSMPYHHPVPSSPAHAIKLASPGPGAGSSQAEVASPRAAEQAPKKARSLPIWRPGGAAGETSGEEGVRAEEGGRSSGGRSGAKRQGLVKKSDDHSAKRCIDFTLSNIVVATTCRSSGSGSSRFRSWNRSRPSRPSRFSSTPKSPPTTLSPHGTPTN